MKNKNIMLRFHKSLKSNNPHNNQQPLISAIALPSCVEFGFRRRRIRKNKTRLGRMRARRAQRDTYVCANPGNPQAAQDCRCLFRTEFNTRPGENLQILVADIGPHEAGGTQ